MPYSSSPQLGKIIDKFNHYNSKPNDPEDWWNVEYFIANEWTVHFSMSPFEEALKQLARLQDHFAMYPWRMVKLGTEEVISGAIF